MLSFCFKRWMTLSSPFVIFPIQAAAGMFRLLLAIGVVSIGEVNYLCSELLSLNLPWLLQDVNQYNFIDFCWDVFDLHQKPDIRRPLCLIIFIQDMFMAQIGGMNYYFIMMSIIYSNRVPAKLIHNTFLKGIYSVISSSFTKLLKLLNLQSWKLLPSEVPIHRLYSRQNNMGQSKQWEVEIKGPDP